MSVRRVIWVAAGLLFVVGVYVAKIAHRMPDFEVYRTAATRALAAEPLYRATDGHWQFKYLTLAAALVVPAVVYGFDGNFALLGDWWATVTETTAPNLIDRNNVSALSVFTRWIGPGNMARSLAMVSVIALLATAAFAFARRRGIEFPEGLEVAMLLTMMPIISPQGWDYVFLVSTPAVMYLVNYRDALPRGVRLAVIAALVVVAFSIWDLMWRQAYTIFMACSIITICYVVEIAGLTVLRVRGIA